MASPEENRAESQERAIAHYQASLRVYNEQDFPEHWARTQNNLGALYSQRLLGDKQENLERASACYVAALRVYTRQVFPEMYRRVALSLADCAVRCGKWELAHDAAAGAWEAEEDLLALAAGVKEQDTILRQAGREGSMLDALALTRLGRYAEAVVSVERGRARTLAAARRLQAADPERIRDPLRRAIYLACRTALQQAQAAMQQAASVSQRPSQERLARAEAMREARALFDAVVEAIRQAGDPADFLAADLSPEALRRVLEDGPAGHALVYLLATPYGGLALGVFGAQTAASGEARFVALELPALTEEALRKRMVTTAADEAQHVVGGYALAFQGRGPGILAYSWSGASFAEGAARLQLFCQEAHMQSTLDAAARETLAQPALAEIAGRPWEHLTEGQRTKLETAFNQAFLRHELRLCLEWLAEAALRPLAAWLQEQQVTGVTLIPCGALVAFPLPAAPLEGSEGQIVTLADRYCVSVAPSARGLQHSVHARRQRSGVAALGNPYPTPQPLPWGEAEALTLANMGGEPARAAVRYNADRAHLLEMLRSALVVDISSHGLAADDYLQSRLLLAHGERLTLADALNETIADLHGLRLLILSACQTAIPDLLGAPDEVRSLAVGMLQAGARAVLATLWSVNDRATFLLIVRFAQEWFPHMENEPPAAALARAQRWLRTATVRELLAWQDSMPVAEVLSSVLPSPGRESQGVIKENLIPPARGPSAFDEGEWNEFAARQKERDGAWKAPLSMRELTLQWAREHDPESCPYADPCYWASFQLYGW